MTISKTQPREYSRANPRKEKIVFVDHDYHEKTLSSEFFLAILRQHYEVTVVLDRSWKGKEPFPDLSFVTEDYRAVVFWQVISHPASLKDIKNRNLLYVPMYDSVTLEKKLWCQAPEYLKILSFARTMHRRLKRWGFNSLHFQYFPAVPAFTPGEPREIFFWQRTNAINFDTVKALFQRLRRVAIHIHKVPDPHQRYLKPSRADEKRFNVTYSDWFREKEDLYELIRQKGIYIAPRAREGIGMSFLEAMAMGKAVIGVDDATMNEYIEHGKTGFLFDLRQPREINFRDVKAVQKNTYEFMCKGREKWERAQSKIIDFIESEPLK